MEFLGDAILQLVTSVYVYDTFPLHHEGHLSVSDTIIILVYFGGEKFPRKCSKNSFVKKFSRIIHIFVKLVFVTKQRNAKFAKIFYRQNKPVYSIDFEIYQNFI